MKIDRRSLLGIVAAAVIGPMDRVFAQETAWPSKAIRLVVPFPVGAGPDTYARLVAAKLERALKTSVWVDNKPGASGIIGTDAVAKARPDGYTFLYGFNQIVVFNPHLFEKLPYNAANDLIPVSQLLSGAYVIVASNGFEASTLPQLIQLAKRRPKVVNYASYGPGTASHLGFALLETMAGIELFHVPYKQGALTDVIAGQISLVLEPSQAAIPQIKAGKVKALAVTSLKRLPSLPDVPTVAEALAGFELTGWHAVFTPAKTPAAIVERMSSELKLVMALDDVQQRLAADSITPLGSTPNALRDVIARESMTWGQLIRNKGIRLE